VFVRQGHEEIWVGLGGLRFGENFEFNIMEGGKGTLA
jgi:hypothetical protein